MGGSTSTASNCDNFYSNVRNGLVPNLSSITYEGLINSYYFDTGVSDTKLVLDPSFTYASYKDSLAPQNAAENYFLTIGLNSVYDNNPPRQKLKILFLLDISGSMSFAFSMIEQKGATQASKLDVAKNSLVNLVKNQLRKDDCVSIATFHDAAEIVLPLTDASQLTPENVIQLLSKIGPQGGTNMYLGLETGFNVLQAEKKKCSEKYEYRMIVLTDMNVTLGGKEDKLHKLMTTFAEDEGIYCTYIGIGLDFDTNLAENLAGIKGGNYFAVAGEQDFRRQMGENFDYMVSPIVFDTVIKLDSTEFAIEQVYGVPGKDNQPTNELIRLKNVFPSPKDSNDLVKGGVILAKLRAINPITGPVTLNFTTTFTDFLGNLHEEHSSLMIEPKDAPFFESSGIQKAILLYEWLNLSKHLVSKMKQGNQLEMSDEDKKLLQQFHDRYVQEMQELDDPSLGKEVEVIVKFLNANQPAQQQQQEQQE